MKNWIFRTHREPTPVHLAEKTGVSQPLADLLWRRGLTEDELSLFLSPLLKYLAAPSSWPGIKQAAELISDNLLAGNLLAVWGDYDVDGITATALVLQVLQHYSLPAEWHLPDRQTEGYGLNTDQVKNLAARNVKILLTVDCGISDMEVIGLARRLGMLVVVSDHHLPPEQLPDANVLCNPKLASCPSQDLAGVGVAFFLMAELNNILAARTGIPKLDMRETLDLVALGTLADMVNLSGQNRVLAKNGLLKLSEAKRPGISELKLVSGFLPQAKLGAGQIVFSLAPRINAAGRMASASLALELLTSSDYTRVAFLAKELDTYNMLRRREEESIVQEALKQAELCHEPALILFGRDWNQGLIGIVASRMVELYHKPCLVLCEDGEFLKGSGRSIGAFHLLDGLVACSKFLLNYGGHTMAAGFRVSKEMFHQFRNKFMEVVLDKLGVEPIKPTQMLDGELDFGAASDWTFLKELELMQPFGVGNPEPVFASPPLLVRRKKLFGALKQHVSLDLQDEISGVTLQAKAWKKTELIPADLEGKRIRIAYSLSLDAYNGISNVDVRIKDWEILS